MSLSDKIINGIMGTNIRTIKVSVEQLAQIVNETIIAATTNEEELRAIEKAIKGSHFFYFRRFGILGWQIFISYQFVPALIKA